MITDIDLTSTSSPIQFSRPGSRPIMGRSWGSEPDCKAVALLVHGLGAHSGWFEAFGRQLQERDIFAVSYDHIGFGNRRDEHFSSYQDWLDDLILVFMHIALHAKDKPLYLIGNSMGALLSMVCAQYVSPDGLVLLSPGFDGCGDTFTPWYRIKTVIKALLFPEMEVSLPYGIELCTRSSTVATWINQDPEGRFMVPGKMLFQLLQLSNATKNKAMSVTMPVLMITAGLDKIVDNAVNKTLFEKLVAPTKATAQFSESFHDLMFDCRVDEVADQVMTWITQNSVERLTTGTNL